jgi:hypothetical protein
MLYDPKWKAPAEAPAKPQPSVQGFIAWLETKNPRGRYEYWNCQGHCLIGQYVNAIGLRWDRDSGPGRDWWYSHPDAEPLLDVSAEEPHTFGAALKRVRALGC